MFPVSEKFKKHLSYGWELTPGYLVVKTNCFEDEDIRVGEILEKHQAKIVREVWQSKINFYISYDYKPFTTELFLHIYYIKGEQKYLEWLQGKIKDYYKSVEFLEKCYLSLPAEPTDITEKKK